MAKELPLLRAREFPQESIRATARDSRPRGREFPHESIRATARDSRPRAREFPQDSGRGFPARALPAWGGGLPPRVDSGGGEGLSAPGEGISAGLGAGVSGGGESCSGSGWGLWRLRTHKPKPPKANISPNSPSRGSGSLNPPFSTGSGAGVVSGYSNFLDDSGSGGSARSPDFWRDRGRDGGSDTEADTGADAGADATSGLNSTNFSGDIRQ